MQRSELVSIDRRPGQGTPRREPLSFVALLSRAQPGPTGAFGLPSVHHVTGLLRWGQRSYEARWLVLPGLLTGTGSFRVDVSGRHAGAPGPNGAQPRNPDIALTPDAGGAEGQLCIHRLLDGRRRPGLALIGDDWDRFHRDWRQRSQAGRADRLWVAVAGQTGIR